MSITWAAVCRKTLKNWWPRLVRGLVMFAYILQVSVSSYAKDLPTDNSSPAPVPAPSSGSQRVLPLDQLKSLLLSPLPTILGANQFFEAVRQDARLGQLYGGMISSDAELAAAAQAGQEFYSAYRRQLIENFGAENLNWIMSPHRSALQQLDNWPAERSRQRADQTLPYVEAERQARAETMTRYGLGEAAFQSALTMRGSLVQSEYTRRLNALLNSPVEKPKMVRPFEKWRAYTISQVEALRVRNLQKALELASRYHNPVLKLKDTKGERRNIRLRDLVGTEIRLSTTSPQGRSYHIHQVGGLLRELRTTLGEDNILAYSALRSLGFLFTGAPNTLDEGTVTFVRYGSQAEQLSLPMGELSKIFAAMRLPGTYKLQKRKHFFEKRALVEAGEREEHLTSLLEMVRPQSHDEKKVRELLASALTEENKLTVLDNLDLSDWVAKEPMTTETLSAAESIRWYGFSLHPSYWGVRDAVIRKVAPDAPNFEDVVSRKRAPLASSKLNSIKTALTSVTFEQTKAFDPARWHHWRNRAVRAAIILAAGVGLGAGVFAGAGSLMSPASKGSGSFMGEPDREPRFHKVNPNGGSPSGQNGRLFTIVSSEVSESELPRYFNLWPGWGSATRDAQFKNSPRDAQFVLRSERPLDSVLSDDGIRPLPEAEGYKIVSVKVTFKNLELRLNDDYDVRAANGLPVLQFHGPKDQQELRAKESLYEVGYQKDYGYERERERFPKLSAQLVQDLSYTMKGYGFTVFSQNLAQAASRGRPIGFDELAQISANSANYVFGPPPMGQKEMKHSPPSLEDLSQYVLNGVYLTQCTGADILLQTALSEARMSSKEQRMLFDFGWSSMSGFVRKPGAFVIDSSTGHQHTLIVHSLTGKRLYVDATPGNDPNFQMTPRVQPALAEQSSPKLATQSREEFAPSSADPLTTTSLVVNPNVPDWKQLLRKSQDSNVPNKKGNVVEQLEALRLEVIEALQAEQVPERWMKELPSTRVLSLFQLMKLRRSGQLSDEQFWKRVDALYPGLIQEWQKSALPNGEEPLISFLKFVAQYEQKRRANGQAHLQKNEDVFALFAYDMQMGQRLDEMLSLLGKLARLDGAKQPLNQCHPLFVE